MCGKKKDQRNSGSNNPRKSKNSKNKTKCPTFRASDKNHSALRTTTTTTNKNKNQHKNKNKQTNKKKQQ